MPLTEFSPLEMDRMDTARLAPLMAGREQEPKKEEVLPVEDEDEAQFLPVQTLRTQYIDYLTTKVDEIEEQKDARRYYHSAQYTAEQIRILKGRHQPPITWNRVQRKINGIVGLVSRNRSDPKALPRTPKSEQGAEIATQTIRYVLDANEWKSIEPWCLLQCGIDGIAGVQLTLIQGDKGDPDIKADWVIGDEYFYDPKSYQPDFDDVRYEGISKWMDVDAAVELFGPEKKELIEGLFEGDSDLTTNADRDYKWVITASKRIRLVEHWYKHKGKWCWAFYVSTVLIDQGVSPFFDEDGNSASSFSMFSAAVDHDGDRYGFGRNLKGPQDSLNQSKSKSLHLANTKLIRMEKGAVDDVELVRREVARPDGVAETNPGKLFEIVDTKPQLAIFQQFAEDAKAELDQYANSNVASLSGSMGNISGRAIELLRQPGMAELGPFVQSIRAWKLRTFRKIWGAALRHWKAERWIRVTNNDGIAQFIQLNGVDLDQFGRPVMVNAVGSLDVDVILEEGPDIASLQQDIYEALKGYPPGTFPPQMMIEMLPNVTRSEKDKYLKMLAPKPPQMTPVQQMVEHLNVEGLAARNAKTAAEARKADASVEQVLATAEEKRAKVPTEAAKASRLATQSHLEGAEFVRDTFKQAHEIASTPLPGQGAPQQGGPPR